MGNRQRARVGVNRHLIALQRIAEQNGGNRVGGSAGHVKSAEYVENQVRAAGYDVSRTEFTFRYVEHPGPESVTVDGKRLGARWPCPPRTTRRPAADYASGSYRDTIALVPISGCPSSTRLTRPPVPVPPP